MRFTNGRNFHLRCAVADPSVVPTLHVRKFPCKRGGVVFEYIAYCKDTGSVEILLEVSGLLRVGWIEKYFENVVGGQVKCMMLRTRRQSEKVLRYMRNLKDCEITESGDDVGDDGLYPPRKADSLLVSECVQLRKRLVMLEKRLAEQVDVAVDAHLVSRIGAERLRDTAYAENYWRMLFLAYGKKIAEMQMERGFPVVEAWKTAKNEFMDLKWQISAMDERAHEKTFELYDLKNKFDLERSKLKDGGDGMGSWAEWVTPAADTKGHLDVIRLHGLVRDMEKRMVELGVGLAGCGLMEEELAEAQHSEGSVFASVVRSACTEIESKYREMCAEYSCIDLVYCQVGLRRVLFEQEIKLASLDRQIRRATDACARMGCEAKLL